MNQDINTPLSPDDVREIKRLVMDHRNGSRPFSLAVALNTSGDRVVDVERAQLYEAAGADWWQEGVYPPAKNLEALQSIVRKGPPRQQ